VLSGFGPGEWQLVEWDGKPVRYRPAIRATARVRVRARDTATGRVEEQSVYAKVYDDPEKGRLASWAQRELHDQVANSGSPFTVAQPIAYADELRTLVQGGVIGTSLKTLLRQQGDPTPSVRATARAVAEFHQLAATASPRRTQETTRPLRNAQEWLRSARPDLARTVAGILDVVTVGLGGVPPMPTHGDLKPQHVLLNGDRVALIDFDDLAEGDPWADVANLVAQLALTRSEDRARTAVQVFLEEYLARVPASWRSRLPWTIT
jgi:Ser/Thr protein kinase RdoA (MazF antagonist)